MPSRRFLSSVLASVVLLGIVASAQRADPRGADSAAARVSGKTVPSDLMELAGGWAFLAQGQVDQARKAAAQVLKSSPRSVGALLLAVETDIVSEGASAALTQYDRWLGERTMEEPGVLRRIAYGTLRGEARQTEDAPARVEALRSLAADGDEQAAAELSRAQGAAGVADSWASAAKGDPRAATALIAQLNNGIVDVRAIDALGESGSKAAIAPLTAQLKDMRPHIRAAAASALGKLGDTSVVAALKPMLNDPTAAVRVNAAGALYRLGDSTGVPLLQQLMAEQSPQVRLAVAEVMASRPDGTWMALLKDLIADQNPEIQARAARLLAPHDPDSARKILDPLARHENPAIRDLAAQGLGDVVTSDLTSLRGLLRNPSRLTRVRAAARILDVTR
jgi:HEAT repeat protein